VNTKSLREAVADYFSGSEWSIAFEVGNATGAAVKRHADAVAMSLWPSRGLSLHGIEMKISRGDWQRELAAPEKAEEIHQHCNFWWLAAAKGVVKHIDEVPPTWGLLEMTEAGTLRMKRHARFQERGAGVPRSFVAGILRARDRSDADEFTRAVNRRVEERVQRAVEERTQDRRFQDTEAQKRLRLLETACKEFGVGWMADDDLCRAVAFVMKSGLCSNYAGLSDVLRALDGARKNAESAAKDIRDAVGRMGLNRGSEQSDALSEVA
jgi:hypothetical protein